jgi:ribulose 1,5-bisphosphate carboxylase large subunit-like protein
MTTNNSSSIYDRIDEKCRQAKKQIDKYSKKQTKKTKWYNNISSYSVDTSKVSRSPQID